MEAGIDLIFVPAGTSEASFLCYMIKVCLFALFRDPVGTVASRLTGSSFLSEEHQGKHLQVFPNRNRTALLIHYNKELRGTLGLNVTKQELIYLSIQDEVTNKSLLLLTVLFCLINLSKIRLMMLQLNFLPKSLKKNITLSKTILIFSMLYSPEEIKADERMRIGLGGSVVNGEINAGDAPEETPYP